jgi:UDPglucose 6-dehydrogenase
MIAMADEVGVKGDIFKAVENRNMSQKIMLVDRLREYLGGSFKDRTVAVWGLAFKPDTDDIREAPAIAMIELLLNEGARINCYDPKALANTRNLLGTINISYLDDQYAATENSDVLIVATEWRQFKQPDFKTLAKQLRAKCILDGRNIYNPQRVNDYGLDYIGIGRSRLIQ